MGDDDEVAGLVRAGTPDRIEHGKVLRASTEVLERSGRAQASGCYIGEHL
ncbi:MAG TPA: hypothetical protein VNM50_09325 [Chloroflexota bacterium]|nr:hypothetical protein [Chloroflexota bacterium]